MDHSVLAEERSCNFPAYGYFVSCRLLKLNVSVYI